MNHIAFRSLAAEPPSLETVFGQRGLSSGARSAHRPQDGAVPPELLLSAPTGRVEPATPDRMFRA